MPKRLEYQLYVGYPLGTPQNTIFDVKTSPRWTPKIWIFVQKSLKKILAITVFGPRCLLEAIKSLPKASQEPSKGPQEPAKSLQEAPMQSPRKFRREGCFMSMSLHLELLAWSGMPMFKWNAYVSAVCGGPRNIYPLLPGRLPWPSLYKDSLCKLGHGSLPGSR